MEGLIVQPRGRKSFRILGIKRTEVQGRGRPGCLWMSQAEQGQDIKGRQEVRSRARKSLQALQTETQISFFRSVVAQLESTTPWEAVALTTCVRIDRSTKHCLQKNVTHAYSNFSIIRRCFCD